MHARKLRTALADGYADAGMIRIEDAETLERIAGCYSGGQRSKAGDEAIAAELVRRWNAYPQLIENLKALVSKEKTRLRKSPSFNVRSARALLKNLETNP